MAIERGLGEKPVKARAARGKGGHQHQTTRHKTFSFAQIGEYVKLLIN